MQGTSVNDRQDRDGCLACAGVADNHGGSVSRLRTTLIPRAAGHRLSGECSRALARFSIAVLIGVGATLAWQSYGDEAMEMLSTRFPSLRLFSVSTTTSVPDGQGSAQDVSLRQSALVPQREAPAAATISELPQLDPMARDVAAMRRGLEQLAVKQEQMAQSVATLQATEQDIRQKILSLSQTTSVAPRKPPKPAARSSPVQSPPTPPAASGPITLSIALGAALTGQSANVSRNNFAFRGSRVSNPSVIHTRIAASGLRTCLPSARARHARFGSAHLSRPMRLFRCELDD